MPAPLLSPAARLLMTTAAGLLQQVVTVDGGLDAPTAAALAKVLQPPARRHARTRTGDLLVMLADVATITGYQVDPAAVAADGATCLPADAVKTARALRDVFRTVAALDGVTVGEALDLYVAFRSCMTADATSQTLRTAFADAVVVLVGTPFALDDLIDAELFGPMEGVAA